MNTYNVFKNNFKNIIINNNYYNKHLNFIKNFTNNLLLFSTIGFPMDLYIDEIIKAKFNLTTIYKNECSWNKNIIYIENQHFFEIDLLNPNMTKDYSLITKLLLYIIKSKNLVDKHFIIIKNIDLLEKHFFAFRILLEKYSNNVYFLCTTFKLSKIENPIKSRFNLIRLPLFTLTEIKDIFNNLKIPLNKYCTTRNIIQALFIAQVEINEPELISYEFCNYNYPPLFKFAMEKKINLNDIRLLSFKCCQYNISISQLTQDLLLTCNDKKKSNFIKNASFIDNYLCKTNKGREPIYIENLLCQYFL